MTIKPRATIIAPNTVTVSPENPDDLVNKIYVDNSISESNIATTIKELNIDTQSIIFGQPVILNLNGVIRANAGNTNFLSARVFGMVADNTINMGQLGNIVTTGILSNTAIYWAQIIVGNNGSGLTPGSYYFLDPYNPGMITSQVPTTTGIFLVRVGIALSATQLELIISDPILL